MSDFFTNLDINLKLAEGTTISGVSKGLNELYQTLQSEDARQKITTNSLNNDHNLTWNSLLLRCHQCLVVQTSRIKGRSKPALERQSTCCTLVNLIMRHASTPTRIHLNINDLMHLITEILTAPLYDQCHNEYLLTLCDLIFPNNLYRNKMTLDDWKYLLEICLDLYNSSHINKSILVQVIQKIVIYGCQRGHFHRKVLDILPLVKKLFEDVVENPSTILNPAYRLLTTIIQHIGTENRRTLCEFTEKLLPSALSVLETGGDERDELLYYIVILHHPRGATAADKSSYAHNWVTWRRIMLTIQNTILRQLEPVQMTRNFVKLGAEVLHQVILDDEYRSEDVNNGDAGNDELGPQIKRRKLSQSVQTLLDLFDIESSKNSLDSRLPVVQVLSALLKNYPETLKPTDFHALLKITSELFTEATEESKITDTLCHLARTLIKIEKQINSHSKLIDLDTSSTKYWDKIFDVLITLGKGQNEIERHKLLQSLIEYRGVQNVNAFVNLYLTNAIKWSTSSIQTLLILCNNIVILDDISNSGRSETETDRQRLIRWCLEPPGYKILHPEALEDLSNLITGLTLKTWDRRLTKFQTPDDDFLDSSDDDLKCINNLQKCHLSLNFETDLFTPETPVKLEKSETLKLSVSEENFHFSLKIISSLLDFPAEREDFSPLICRLTIVAKCLSNFLDLDIDSSNMLESLIALFTSHFIDILELMTETNKLERMNVYAISLVRSLVTLYSSKYHKRIGNIILENTSVELLRSLFVMLNIQEKNEPDDSKNFGIKYYENIFDMKCLGPEEKRSQLTIGTHQVLTAFSLLETGISITKRQIKVLNNLLKAEIYSKPLLMNLWKSLALLKAILKARSDFYIDDLLVNIGNFILDLFDLWKNDFHGIKGILEVIPGFVELFSKTKINYEGLLVILKSSVKSPDQGYSGPVIETTFLESMCRIIELKPASGPELMSPDELFKYISSDLYVVRLESMKILHLMFASNEISILHKKSLFEKIEEIEMSETKSIFIVEGNLSGQVREDEKINRTFTALYILGVMINASGIFHPQALNIMFRLHTKRIQDISLMKKIFSAAIPREEERLALINNNLYDLMKTGMEEEESMGDFWMMTNCKSEVDFYETYIGIFILIKLEIHEFHKIQILCESLGIPLAKAIEDNFPAILSWILAAMVKVPDSEPRNYLEDIYSMLKTNTGNFINVRNFSQLLEEKLSDVLLDFLQRLHDKEHFREMFQVSVYFPKMSVPNFKHEVIVKALEELKVCVLGNLRESLVQYLIVKRPDVVQKILSTLIHNIHDQTMVEYKLKVFHHYSFFCQLLISEISDNYFNEMSTFVVRDITYTLIHLIKDSNKLFTNIVFDFMHQFLTKLLPSRSREVSGILNYLMTNLISIIQSSKDKKALKILKLLIVDNTEYLKDSIKTLGEFPNSREFDEIRGAYNSLKQTKNETWTLKSEMEHFLNAGQEKTLSCSIEGLIHLRKELSKHRDDLQKMYKSLEKLRGFAEDCKSSTLHRLTYRLIKLTESPSPNIALEASRCLGELGPTDLTTMILHPEEGHLQEDGDAIQMLTETIISKLSDYLIEESLELREASAAALYEVYASPWGQKIIKDYKKQLGADDIDIPLLTILKNTRPFLIKSTLRFRSIELDPDNCGACLNHRNDMWKGEGGDSYSSWIKKVTCTVLNCFTEFYTPSLIPVCKLNVEFCEAILPRLMYLFIETDEESLDFVCKCINRFFAGYFQAASFTEQTISVGCPKVEFFSHESVRCMLNIVNFIRIQSADNLSSKLKYLPIAKAAQYCSAYFTSLLYAELSSETLKKDVPRTPNDISMIDHLCEVRPDEGKALQEILREAFIKIGDPDSIHGCGLSHLKDPSSRIQHYIQFNKWDIVMTAQDVELSSGASCSRGMINALQHTGLDYLLSKYLSTIKKDENVEEYTYETAWRLADWNLISPKQISNKNHKITSNDYEYYHYHSLKCLQENNSIGVRDAVENARVSVINSLRNTSLECSQTIYPKLLKLQMLREVEELNVKKIDEWSDIISDWKQDLIINDFPYIEPILSQRIAMFKIKYDSSNDLNMKNSIVDTYLELSKVAQEHGYLHIAGRALEYLGRTSDLSDEMKDQLNYREAFLAWTRGDQYMARFLLRNLINKSSINPRLLSQGLKLWGNWMTETKSETPKVIEEYYQRSIEILNSLESPRSEDFKNLNDTRAALAQFADAQYQYTTEFMKTPLFESLKETAKFVRQGNKIVKEKPSEDKKVRAAMIKNQTTDRNDFAEFEKIQKEQNMYLTLAIKYYCMTLMEGDYNNFLVFRLVSLWFKNMEHEEVNRILSDYLNDIPTHKFIALIPQLAPHISTERTNFSDKINKLVKICAKEHPHHVLPVLLALRNTNKDNEYQKTRVKTLEPPLRVYAAKRILDELMRTDIRKIIEEMTRTAEALMMLAHYEVDKKRSGVQQKIPGSQQIHKIKNYQNCMVPTINLDVQVNGNYDNVVGIYEFKFFFEFLGGINAPKKIYCIGTDGVTRNQVIKVDADIKNDSIMQQVFNVMNSLFRSSKETKRRKLNIRTYKVVSLSQQSGVLQWCDNTMPMTSILIGSQGLHGKYHRDDWKPDKCKQLIEDVKYESDETRLRVYLKCCEHLHPAFQYFFLERFPSPETWFERRMAYMRSVATTSMVGYILGLGDRHFSNILIDQTTAEIVHIDFGIAFEQGKTLPLPETIPFRLTRDMVAAMGVSGVEGVMRRCCEETMTVLRDRREMIITLLQVLIYDPLFSWSISPYKAYKMQSEDSSRFTESGEQDTKPTNKMAERALLRIEQKLHGTEEGIATNIAGQVDRLIQQARDPANLSRIFCGWQAYL